VSSTALSSRAVLSKLKTQRSGLYFSAVVRGYDAVEGK